MRIQSLFYPVLGILFIFRNLLQGLGYSFITMLAGVTELVARAVVAFGFVGKYGFAAVCYASPVAWASAALMLTVLYFMKIQLVLKKYPYDKNNPLPD